MTGNLTTTIDMLGELQVRIAKLEAEAKALKAVLVEVGPGSYEGERFKVTVTTCERNNLDMKAVREKLSPQFIRCHTTTTQVTSVRVTARMEAA